MSLTIHDEREFVEHLELEIGSIAIEFLVMHPAIHRDVRNTPNAEKDLRTAIRKGMRYVLELEGIFYDD